MEAILDGNLHFKFSHFIFLKYLPLIPHLEK